MRNFEFDNNSTDISAANIAGVRPNLDPPVESLRQDEPLDEPARETLREDALSAFHNSSDDDESDNNTAKIAGAVLIGLLLVGGSIYAYVSTTANHTPQTVAMLPAPQHNATADQAVTPPATTPDTSNIPSANSPAPAMSAPKPAHSIRSGLATATPESAASVAPAATPAPAQQDAAVNQPMTLTPETAPAPQQSAMQQPITAPNVSGQTSQPTPEVANNNASSDTVLPSGAAVQPNLTPPADTPAPSDTTSPATPAAPLPTPAQ